MATIVDEALAELKKLPGDVQEAIARDLLQLIRSERKWDALFADPRSAAALERLAAEADVDVARGDVCNVDPATRPERR